MTGDPTLVPRVELAPVRAGEELDWVALETYLRPELGDQVGDSATFEVLQFPNGSANLTYRVQLGDQLLVVRRPPFGQIAVGAHDMAREHKVLSRLHRAYPRAPRAYLHCGDPAVIGAEFLVSEYRPGVVVWDEIPATMQHAADAGRDLGFAVVDALADLHDVDYAACDLESLGRPEGYLARQVAGWTRRWQAVATPGSELVGQVAERLAQAMPTTAAPSILHNDFKIDNCQFAPDDPTRVVSVFDWDMATLGDPLVDLGTLLNYWPQGDEPNAVPGLDRLDLPTRDEVVERYARRRGLSLSDADVDWYEAYGCWKTAVILQQLYMRHMRGETTDPRMAERGAIVVPLARRAHELLQQQGRQS